MEKEEKEKEEEMKESEMGKKEGKRAESRKRGCRDRHWQHPQPLGCRDGIVIPGIWGGSEVGILSPSGGRGHRGWRGTAAPARRSELGI